MSRAASTTPAPVGSLRPIGTTGYGGRGERERAAAVRAALAAGAPTPRVAIIGAGAAGLCMAIRLRDAGIDSFTIYEKSDGVGGTWRDNTYPGAACDVPSHLYSFSFASKRDWTRRFAGQPEILGYFESLVDRFDLSGHLRLGTEVTEAHYDDATGTWTLRTATSDGEPSEGTSAGTVVADVVVSGLGQLNRPYVPDIPGLDAFVEGGGTVFHSARWDHDHDLSEDRVGVVGIGASAIQFVPPVAASAAHTTLFQRSANYVGPRNDREFTPRERWIFENVPGAQKAYRESIYWRFEARFNVMRAGSRLGRWMQGQFRKGLQPMVSERLPEAALVPDYPVGCKRILIADDWYPTLLRPDVDVVTSGIERIEDGAVLTDDGRRTPVDTLIFGTGFRSTEFLSPLKITGRSGRDLNEVWVDGARAYMGLAVPGFPNLFMLYGPNTNLGHNSILFMIEQQVGYTLRLIEEKVLLGLRSVEVSEGAASRYDTEVQTAADRTVWAEGCHSWYKNADGRITNNWTDHTTVYRRLLSSPDPSDWLLERAGSD
ncbi:MAG TPA: NAD(P)/FAD-dependent oxidoreductase [Microthrixaceae bacterium]|nr:NAD(P)/FAD-dependent oxidoreductase [Microthrixaceae bacterium]